MLFLVAISLISMKSATEIVWLGGTRCNGSKPVASTKYASANSARSRQDISPKNCSTHSAVRSCLGTKCSVHF